MYIPSYNQFTDKHDVIAFIERYSFATIVTTNEDMPVATHLPFIVNTGDKNRIILLSHFAKANPQGDSIDGKDALVIFMEPHAYISPRNYEKLQNVPTWNYIAVHAYGRCTLITDIAGKKELLKQTVLKYEGDYIKQWDDLSSDYKNKMINGITAFKVEIDNLQAKKKLSQNREEKERENIINDLSNKQTTAEIAIAAYMKELMLK